MNNTYQKQNELPLVECARKTHPDTSKKRAADLTGSEKLCNMRKGEMMDKYTIDGKAYGIPEHCF